MTIYDSDRAPDDSGLHVYHVYFLHDAFAATREDAIRLTWAAFTAKHRRDDFKRCLMVHTFDEEQLCPDEFIVIVNNDLSIDQLFEDG